MNLLPESYSKVRRLTALYVIKQGLYQIEWNRGLAVSLKEAAFLSMHSVQLKAKSSTPNNCEL
ncbi:hypothetical protein CULT_1770004 [[Clostridium] ultunense Esp]|nr:hypothetical protein CULT_1770004 [[Clostridium] ultunense Esp]